MDGGACEYSVDWSINGAFVDGATAYDTAAAALVVPMTFCCDDGSKVGVCASACRGSKIDWKPGKFEIDDGGGTFAANCCGLKVGTGADAAANQSKINGLFLHMEWEW